MSVTLDPKEVLYYLNELGYYNITTEQLKEFMTDLKKLILYDLKKAEKENQPGIRQKTTTVREYFQQRHLRQQKSKEQENAQTKKVKSKSAPTLVNDVFSNLHSASTVSSRARSTHPSTSEESKQVPNFYDIPNRALSSQPFQSAYTLTTNDYTDGYVTEHVSVNTGLSQIDSKDFRNVKSGTTCKPTVSFIRPQTAKKHYSEKSDPVALYHKYKEEWDRQKLPGHKHSSLRWCVREKMLSGPSIQVRPATSTTSTKKWKTPL